MSCNKNNVSILLKYKMSQLNCMYLTSNLLSANVARIDAAKKLIYKGIV